MSTLPSTVTPEQLAPAGTKPQKGDITVSVDEYSGRISVLGRVLTVGRKYTQVKRADGREISLFTHQYNREHTRIIARV